MAELSCGKIGEVAVLRVGADLGLPECVQQVKDAILQARHAGVAALLVDVTAVGFGPPSIAERHGLVSEWAMAGRSAVRVALVVRPEFIDPQQFGAAVARSRGLDFKVFSDDGQALAWVTDSRGRG